MKKLSQKEARAKIKEVVKSLNIEWIRIYYEGKQKDRMKFWGTFGPIFKAEKALKKLSIVKAAYAGGYPNSLDVYFNMKKVKGFKKK